VVNSPAFHIDLEALVANLWDEKYELNIKEIDTQHKNFFSILESTDQMTEKEELDDQDIFQLMRLLMELRNYGFLHFYTEEKLMVKCGFPEFLIHLELHDDFMYSMKEYRVTFLELFKIFQEGHANHEEIREFIKGFVKYVAEWWQEHISNKDAKYAYFIKTKS
jgi:hemerythrin